MKNFIQMIRVTLVGGVLFIVPFVLLILVLDKALDLIRVVINPMSEKLLVETTLGLGATKVIAIILLVILCFAAGLFARTDIAKRVVAWIETTLLSNLPGYSFMKNVGEEASGAGATEQYQSVLVRFDDSSQIGFLVERLESEQAVVFIPGSPNPWSGSTRILDEDRITLIDKATNSSIKVIQKLGAGTSNLIKE